MLIHYCEGCGLRVPDADLKSGTAVQADENKFFCAKCAVTQALPPRTASPSATTEFPAARVPMPAASAARVTSRVVARGTSVAHAASGRATALGEALPAAAQKSNTMLLAGGGTGLMVLALAIWMMLGKSAPDTKQAVDAPIANPPVSAGNEPLLNKIEKPLQAQAKSNATVPPIQSGGTVILKDESKGIDTKRAGGGLFGAMAQDRPSDADADKWRANYAARLLEEAKKYAAEHADDPEAVRFKYKQILLRYESLPAGLEAAKLVAAMPPPNGSAPQGYVWREVWMNIGGGNINNLTGNSAFPSKPTTRTQLTTLAGPIDCADNYGTRIRGYVHPPADGAYTFWIASDDEGQLFLSPDESPESKTLIAHCPHAVGSEVWGALPKQNSAPIALARGKRYYIEVLHKEGGGNDHLAVGWQLPSGVFERPIQGFRLSPFEDGAAPAVGSTPNPAPVSVPVPTPAGAAVNAPVLAAESSESVAKIEYEQLLADAYLMLAKNAVPQVVAKLEEAKANPKFSAQRALLERDVASARYMEALRKAAVVGAAKLADKAPFVLTKNDGKGINFGGGSKNTVRSVNDETILIDQDLGGGTASIKVSIEELNGQTQWELARRGLPAEAESQLKLAFAALVSLQNGRGFLTPKAIATLLDGAEKGHAPAEAVRHIRARLDACESEQNADVAFKKINALAKDKKWADLKYGIIIFRKEYAGTLALSKSKSVLTQLLEEVESNLNPLKPGLWGSYWSGDNGDKFKTMHFARADTKISYDWGDNPPDPRVPNKDFFGIRWAGKLRIDRDGKYHLRGSADDFQAIYIDGKKVKDNRQEVEIPLSKGDHGFKFIYWEQNAGANNHFEWKLEGSFDWQELPASVLWHDPRQADAYQKE